MVTYFDSEHPKDILLFYVAGRADESVADRLGACLDALAEEIDWVAGPPLFVHQEEDFRDPATGAPVVTVGGVLEFYSAHPPWRDRLPPEVDQAHYRECELLVRRLADLSSQTGEEFHFEFQGAFVGKISAGQPNDQLGHQFLGTWARAVGLDHPFPTSINADPKTNDA